MSDIEIINVLNESGEVVDTMTREEAERDNHITENVLVFVFNSLGQAWTQLRPMSKDHYPGMWDISACGGMLSNETPEEAATRETKEETGLDLDLHFVETFLNEFPGDNGENRRRMSHLYIGVSDDTPFNDDGEVDEFVSHNVQELSANVMANETLYIPSFLVELDKAVEAYRNLGR